jgi:hypothetical protein
VNTFHLFKIYYSHKAKVDMYLQFYLLFEVIFINVFKVIHTVPHNLLVDELVRLGIVESLLSWFRSYLSNRRQFVYSNSISSSLVDGTSGIPQGGHLNSLLFCLYVYSITS